VIAAPGMISPAQMRAARALIGWKQSDLASRSGVSHVSIKNIERGATDPRLSTITAIERAFVDAGVLFLDAQENKPGGAGVRLRD
jgi:predicted transcriptional regulator